MLKSEIKNILEKPIWVLFLTAVAFYVLGLYMFSHFVWSSDIYEYNYKAETGFENYIDMVRRIDFIRYLLSPIYIFLMAFIITGLIKIGLTGGYIDINNNLLFKIVLISILILSLPLWVKVVWFVLIKGSYTMEELKYFYPFSLLNFFDPSDLMETMMKALGRINLYHLVFMAFVAWCIKIYTNVSWWRLFGIVCYTYGFGLLLLQGIIILIFI